MKKNRITVFLLLALAIILAACSSTEKTTKVENYQYTKNGIKYLDIKVGSGRSPKIGEKVTINTKVMTQDSTVLEDTFKNHRPVSFVLYDIDNEKLQVIKGLAEGIMTMKEGGKRVLWIPPEMGFGSRRQHTIPANATLIVTVELLKIE